MTQVLVEKPTRSIVWPVVLATVTAFVASAVYYIVFGQLWLTLRDIDPGTSTAPSPGEAVLQFARNLVFATVLATVFRRLNVATLRETLSWALTIWLGFQAMQILGSVLHEDYPFALYLLHVGDALMTTLIMTLVLRPWSRR